MPASIAHMLISEKARKELGKEKKYKKFSDILEKHKNYMELGSLGPDLPYYVSMVKGAWNILLDRSDKPLGVDQWSYQLHSKDPNKFPLKMLEIVWRDSYEDHWDEQDEKKFAFICGFLSHIAADQMIHPVVNSIAGPYYKGGDIRELHRKCEVYQDVVLHSMVKNGNLMDARPNEWCDLAPNSGKNTEDWFRYMIQKAFVESHAVCPDEQDIEDWVDGILTTLKLIDNAGPYKGAAKDFQEYGNKSNDYVRFFQKPKYQTKCFPDAVKLTTIYIKAAFEMYDSDDWGESERERFLKVVRNADLSSPLEKDIMAEAEKALKEWTGA